MNQAYKKETSDKDIIDVVNNLYYKNQDELYNNDFRAWRKDNKNPYAYNFVHNKKESVYVQGMGFVNSSPREAEKDALSKISSKIGIALIIYLAISTFGTLLAFWVANLFGAGISSKLFMHTGNPSIVMPIEFVIGVLQYSVPAIFLCKTFKLSKNVAFPKHIEDKNELLMGVSLIMSASVIISIFLLLMGNAPNRYGFIGEYEFLYTLSPQNPVLLGYLILEIIFIPILTELFFRSSMFQVLRQFGDWFSIITTSILSVLITHNICFSIYCVVISGLIATFNMRSGSIITGMAMGIIYRIYLVTTVFLSIKNTKLMVAFMICIFLIGLMGIIISSKKGVKTRLMNNRTALSIKEKLFQVVSSPEIWVWLIATLILRIFTL